MSTVLLKPQAGMSIRTPRGDLLPQEGREEELDSYWRRRIADGDVEVMSPLARDSGSLPSEGAAGSPGRPVAAAAKTNPAKE